MKWLLGLLICCVLGCNESQEKLYVYNWADYIDPDVVSEFERENNCKVEIDQFDDNEAMISKLLVNSDGYDVVFPSSYAVELLKKHNLISKFNLAELPNVSTNFDSKFTLLSFDSKLEWSIPYAFSMTGICYRKDKVENASTSWNMLLDEKLNKRVCILNDVREILGISLKINGFSVNSTNDAEIAKALDTAKKFKFAVSKIDNVQYKSGILNSEFVACMGYNSDIFQLIEDNDSSNLEFFIPDEGSTCCFDEMCILNYSKNKDLAMKFIDFLYRPDISARNANYVCAVIPNKNMWKFLPEEAIQNELFNIPDRILRKLEPIRYIENAQQKYTKFWDDFKSIKQ